MLPELLLLFFGRTKNDLFNFAVVAGGDGSGS
jgi:hypothetical protein